MESEEGGAGAVLGGVDGLGDLVEGLADARVVVAHGGIVSAGFSGSRSVVIGSVKVLGCCARDSRSSNERGAGGRMCGMFGEINWGSGHW